MISLEEAQARVWAVDRLHPRAVPLDDALGCVTSVAVTADEMVPPFANTAMDGYALRAGDAAGAPVRLRVVGDLPAGCDQHGMHVGPGEAIRIMTGAPIPDGADAVVMVELTESDGEPGDANAGVLVRAAVPPGNHVRAAGEDLSPGDEVVAPFTTLTPAHLGLLATVGVRRVPVFPRARVGVLSTGDELVDGPGPLLPGQIRDANRHALLAMVAEAGGEPVDLGIVGDDVDAVRKAMADGIASCDALITSGGVSMGAYDPVKVVLREAVGDAGGGGEDATSMQVAIRPAKPLSFAVVDGTPVFGLPGNPASSIVSFELFARPALRRMMGHADSGRRHVSAVAPDGFARTPDGKTHLVRVTVEERDGRLAATSSGGQGSNLLRSMAAADGFAVVPDGDGIPPRGEVRVLLLRDPR